MNDIGNGIALAGLLALLMLTFAIVIAILIARLSWRWSRPGASFASLVFPVCLPLWGMLCCLSMTRPPILWIGFCTSVAVMIWGRAIWLRPAENSGPSSVRRRQLHILLSTIVAGTVYAAWGNWCVVAANRAQQHFDAFQRREAADRIRTAEEWVQGRIVASPWGLCYSPDGRFLATLGSELEVWDLTTGGVYRH